MKILFIIKMKIFMPPSGQVGFPFMLTIEPRRVSIF